MPAGKLTDKVAVITGAGSGIGRAMSILFSREGATVVAADLNEAAARETVSELSGNGMPLRVDVSNAGDVQRMVERVEEAFGRIDILCNNAGIGSTTDVIEADPDEWDQVFAVNVRGTFLSCKYTLPGMITRGGGVIVNTASVAGLIGIPKRAAYCASKGAVVVLTKQIAVSYVSQGIRCNCVCPGTVDSPWVGRLLDATDDPVAARKALEARQPIGRLGTPEEVAAAALYLASDDAAFTTGTALVLDGGWMAS
jgi:2-keto-3-deoxy-L-fuconate dehydrogenase